MMISPLLDSSMVNVNSTYVYDGKDVIYTVYTVDIISVLVILGENVQLLSITCLCRAIKR